METNPDIDAELETRFGAGDFAGLEVTVVVPDRTRPIDYGAHVRPLLERLDEAGAQPSVLVGLGLHRPMAEDELEALAASTSDLDVPLLQHDAEADELIQVEADVSEHRPGWPKLPAEFPPAVVESDAIVSVGTVEPHQYAGFSGGAKGIAIGCGSSRTIGAMHGLEFLRRDGTHLGAVRENPFHAATWRLIDSLPPAWGLQIVPASGVEEERYAFGELGDAFDRAAGAAARRFFTPVERLQDWLHLPLSEGKASNFYQASRAATYVALSERPAVAEGATLVIEAACPEGIGRGSGELACADALARGPATLLAELESDEPFATRGGEQRAYVIAKTLARCDVVLIGAPEIEVLEAAGIPQYENFEAAIRDLGFTGVGRTIRDVFHSVPVLAGDR